MMSEIEVWRSARFMANQFGHDAVTRSVKRATACESCADVDGWIHWMRVAAAVLEIQEKTLRKA